MTKYRTQSANVLNDADSLERRMNWGLFVQEQERILYGPGEWQPGEPLHEAPTWNFGYFLPECQPLIPRCEPCGIFWAGDEPCWMCGDDSTKFSAVAFRDLMSHHDLWATWAASWTPEMFDGADDDDLDEVALRSLMYARQRSYFDEVTLGADILLQHNQMAYEFEMRQTVNTDALEAYRQALRAFAEYSNRDVLSPNAIRRVEIEGEYQPVWESADDDGPRFVETGFMPATGIDFVVHDEAINYVEPLRLFGVEIEQELSLPDNLDLSGDRPIPLPRQDTCSLRTRLELGANLGRWELYEDGETPDSRGRDSGSSEPSAGEGSDPLGRGCPAPDHNAPRLERPARRRGDRPSEGG